MQEKIKIIINRFCQFKEQKNVSAKKIYVFLGLLTFFEVSLEKPHADFVFSNLFK